MNSVVFLLHNFLSSVSPLLPFSQSVLSIPAACVLERKRCPPSFPPPLSLQCRRLPSLPFSLSTWSCPLRVRRKASLLRYVATSAPINITCNILLLVIWGRLYPTNWRKYASFLVEDFFFQVAWMTNANNVSFIDKTEINRKLQTDHCCLRTVVCAMDISEQQDSPYMRSILRSRCRLWVRYNTILANKQLHMTSAHSFWLCKVGLWWHLVVEFFLLYVDLGI